MRPATEAADAGYRGANKRPEAKGDVNWHVAMRPGKRKALDLTDPLDALTDQVERIKASIRAKVEHPFRVIKKQFGQALLHKDPCGRSNPNPRRT